MKARPILMSAPMVRALLDGRKTQTRRIVKPQPSVRYGMVYLPKCIAGFHPDYLSGRLSIEGVKRPDFSSSFGKRGDLLWVRESWSIKDCGNRVSISSDGWPKGWPTDRVRYEADCAEFSWNRRASIHMPRWASRLTLELTDVRVERLREISASDAVAEGIEAIPHTDGGYLNYTHEGAGTGYYTDKPGHPGGGARSSYESLWESINGADSWLTNPWVWALSFVVHQENVDAVLQARAA